MALLSLVVLAGCGPAPPAALAPAPSAAVARDWGTAVADAVLTSAHPSDYPGVLEMLGVFRVYERTRRPAYLAAVRSYVDSQPTRPVDRLDDVLRGNLLVLLYEATGAPRYRAAATRLRDRLRSYPRTPDGAYWHTVDRPRQLWGDGAYMVAPFLARYGAAVGDPSAQAEAVRQLLVYDRHLARPDGLIWHAYDGSRRAPWADPATGHSPEAWCRAQGWFGMSTVDVLDALPGSAPDRGRLLDILHRLAAALVRYQDPVTGRWFQVVDRSAGDWTETSCSAMATYVLTRGVRAGYLDAGFRPAAVRGFTGVLAELSPDGHLAGTCVGTGPGDLAYYLARPRVTDDPHGVGAFLLMYESPPPLPQLH